VSRLSAYNDQKGYPLVRCSALVTAAAIVASGVLSASSRLSMPRDAAPAIPASPRVVAWVDVDIEPVHRLVDRLRPHLMSQHFDDIRPVQLKLVGADVPHRAHLEAQVAELVASKPALIVATSVDVTKALLASKTDIPIYFVIQSDPVREGLVPSLVSTGSLTGYTFFVPLDVKVMELIRRAFPDARTVGIVATDYWLEGSSMSEGLFEEAKRLALEPTLFNLHDRSEIASMLKDPRARKVQVWYIPYTEIAFHHDAELTAALARTSVPTVYARRKFLKLGGLLSVQSVDESAMDVWAKSIANILNGVPVGSIPVMRPKEIEIAINSAALAGLEPKTRDRLAREATIFE
jgi:putative tryptophan/tyrosine transport system substrate-binding protein